MKAIILLFTLASLGFTKKSQELLTMKASFDGYEDGFYYFTNEEDDNFYFETVSKEASEKYDLLKEDFIGKTFEVSYKIETKTDENNDEYESYIIVKLQLIEEE